MSHAAPLFLNRPAGAARLSQGMIWMLGLIFGLVLCLLGSEQASYALSPGVRAARLTILLDDPLPMQAKAEAQTPNITPNILPPPDTPLSIASAFDRGASAVPYRLVLSPENRRRAERCLTDAIYYEAASESEDGQRAVAQVVLNRLRHPAWPKTICGVVYQGSDLPGCQFSYACDGAMQRAPAPLIWARILRIARAALDGAVFAPIGLATYYHTLRVNPTWNRSLTITAVLGNHIFYRLPGKNGQPETFTLAHNGAEPLPAPLTWRGSTTAPPLATAPVNLSMRPAPLNEAARDPKLAFDTTDLYVPGALPQSEVLPRFQQSGSWRTR
jgi:spore germination cell wall hydrolase CwlJ-like protein